MKRKKNLTVKWCGIVGSIFVGAVLTRGTRTRIFLGAEIGLAKCCC